MSWTENKWLKPAWMGKGSDFMNKYQDKFSQIGEKFAPKVEEKQSNPKGKRGIQLSDLKGEQKDVLEMICLGVPKEYRKYIVDKDGYLDFKEISVGKSNVNKASRNYEKLYDIAKYLNDKGEVLLVEIGESLETKQVVKWETKEEAEEYVKLEQLGPYEDPTNPSRKGTVLGMTLCNKLKKIQVETRPIEDEEDELNVTYRKEKVTTTLLSTDGKHHVLVSRHWNQEAMTEMAQTFAHEAYGHFWMFINNKPSEHAKGREPENTRLERAIETAMQEAQTNAFSK